VAAATGTGSSPVTVTILCAGLGTRLARPFPKPLTPLSDGRSIMAQQHDNVRAVFPDAVILLVVGFKLDLIMEAFPDDLYVYNEAYDQTNTSKSLLKALRLAPAGGVLWMNGDVVFDPAILDRLRPLVADDRSFVCVNTSQVADEEVKYTVDDDGYVRGLSKTVVGALGEAIGINFVSSRDRATLIRYLAECDDGEYFERGMELAVEREGLRILPVDISDLYAVEVDVEDDLRRANEAARR
jgi:choline kinase